MTDLSNQVAILDSLDKYTLRRTVRAEAAILFKSMPDDEKYIILLNELGINPTDVMMSKLLNRLADGDDAKSTTKE